MPGERKKGKWEAAPSPGGGTMTATSPGGTTTFAAPAPLTTRRGPPAEQVERGAMWRGRKLPSTELQEAIDAPAAAEEEEAAADGTFPPSYVHQMTKCLHFDISSTEEEELNQALIEAVKLFIPGVSDISEESEDENTEYYQAYRINNSAFYNCFNDKDILENFYAEQAVIHDANEFNLCMLRLYYLLLVKLILRAIMNEAIAGETGGPISEGVELTVQEKQNCVDKLQYYRLMYNWCNKLIEEKDITPREVLTLGQFERDCAHLDHTIMAITAPDHLKVAKFHTSAAMAELLVREFQTAAAPPAAAAAAAPPAAAAAAEEEDDSRRDSLSLSFGTPTRDSSVLFDTPRGGSALFDTPRVNIGDAGGGGGAAGSGGGGGGGLRRRKKTRRSSRRKSTRRRKSSRRKYTKRRKMSKKRRSSRKRR